MANTMFRNIKKNLRDRMDGVIDVEMVEVDTNPIADESEKEKFALQYLKIALGNAYLKDPEATGRVLDILKKEGFVY